MITLSAAFLIAFLCAALAGRRAIPLLQKLKAGQNISQDAPVSHGKKQGTPTMGGLLILISLTLTTLLAVILGPFLPGLNPNNIGSLLPLLLLTLTFGLIGFLDDYLSLKRGRNLGLRAREKFAAQCIAAALFLAWLYFAAPHLTGTQVDILPRAFTHGTRLPLSSVSLGLLYFPIALVFMVGLSNAVNFTDGLDGLAGGTSLIVCLTLASLASVLTPEISLFCVALAGALAGFLWWNAHPAKVFMGDTGSLAIGAALAGAALLSKQEMGLIVASLVSWAELVSVMLQVSVFKWRKKRHGIEYARAHRLFRRTPLHHHFEEAGWPETRVTLRFWIAGALCAALALLWGYRQ